MMVSSDYFFVFILKRCSFDVRIPFELVDFFSPVVGSILLIGIFNKISSYSKLANLL